MIKQGGLLVEYKADIIIISSNAMIRLDKLLIWR
jgi:hypothetical protein